MKLFSRIYGSGKDIIIIHGLFGMSDNWATFAKRLSQKFKVHCVDIRNHGNSPHSNFFDYDFISEDIINYINQNNIFKPHLLGHSLGGKAVMKLVLEKKNIFDKSIVIDIAPKEYDISFHQFLLEKISNLCLENYTSRNQIELDLLKSLKNKAITQFILKNLKRDNERFLWKFNLSVLKYSLKKISHANFCKGVSDLDMMFVKGENSDYINSLDLNRIRNHFSNSKFCEIRNAGHWVHAENPNDLYDEIINFL